MACHGWTLTLDISQMINGHFLSEGFQAASIINFIVALQVQNAAGKARSILSGTSSLGKTYNHGILHGELNNE